MSKQQNKMDIIIKNNILSGLIQEAVSRNCFFRFQARGFSMLPVIKDGDIITLAPLGMKHPALGDIVAFEHPGTGTLIVHRIVAHKNNHYILKGDNHSEVDGEVPAEMILARVIKVDKKKFFFHIANFLVRSRLRSQK